MPRTIIKPQRGFAPRWGPFLRCGAAVIGQLGDEFFPVVDFARDPLASSEVIVEYTGPDERRALLETSSGYG